MRAGRSCRLALLRCQRPRQDYRSASTALFSFRFSVSLPKRHDFLELDFLHFTDDELMLLAVR